MTEVAINRLLTPELLDKLARACGPIGEEAGLQPGRLAAILRDHGVAVVDLDRNRCTVDERVYASALDRGRRWQALAEANGKRVPLP